MSTVYVVTRGDIPEGMRAQQVVHVVTDLCLTFMGGPDIPSSFQDWIAHHKTVVIKRARDLDDLYALYLRMHREVSFHIEGFFEPLLDTELTVFATEPLSTCPTILELLPEL